MNKNFFVLSWVIAKNTFKEIIRDRLLYGVLLIAILLTASSFFLANISLDQNARVLEDLGPAFIHITTLLICVFVTTTAITKDFEGRTLYLLFPKPISRTQYVLGKYLGMLLLLITTLLLLGGLFCLGLLFTNSGVIPHTLIDLFFSCLEISLIMSLAVLFASFTAPLNATLYTIALFIIGHSLGTIQTYVSKTGSQLTLGLVNFFYYLFPNLEKFDLRQSLLYGVYPNHATVFWTIIYWLFYTTLILALSILVVQKREV